MSDKDTYTKNYMSNNEIVADAFNFLLYDGEQVIAPESLKSFDTTVFGTPFGSDNAAAPVRKIRDVLKIVTAKEDENNVYLVLGIENQTDIHFAMPVRNMLYDALEYDRQIKNTAAEHKKRKDNRGVSSGEYLSGFYKDDKLVPVITLVIVFNPGKWNAPRSIYDMLDVKDKRILSFVSDYKINLIVPDELSDDDALKLNSSLREVLLYIKNSNDKEKLSKLVSSNKRFSRMERDAAYVINACTNSNLKINENERVIDLCQAIQDMIKDSKEEGKTEGKIEGRIEGKTEIILNMSEAGFSATDIARIAKMSEEEINKILSSNK